MKDKELRKGLEDMGVYYHDSYGNNNVGQVIIQLQGDLKYLTESVMKLERTVNEILHNEHRQSPPKFSLSNDVAELYQLRDESVAKGKVLLDHLGIRIEKTPAIASGYKVVKTKNNKEK